MQGQAGAKRASYEAKWQFFASKPHEGPITYEEVPWILPEEAGAEELQHVVLYGGSGAIGLDVPGEGALKLALKSADVRGRAARGAWQG